MSTKFSRRNFLKLSGLALGSLASWPARGWLPSSNELSAFHAENLGSVNYGIGRVTISQIGVYRQPDLESEKVGMRSRDELLNLLDEVRSPSGPPLNPRWYRVSTGYVHSAYLQRVENLQLNRPASTIPRMGRLGEITVPFTQSLRLTKQGWEPVYRLYYQSIHWITGIDEGPDGDAWYRLTDELLRLDYHVPAVHVRPIHSAELAPISPDIPEGKKWIEVSLIDQTLKAFEDGEIVLDTQVSTGLPGLGIVRGIPTETPRGRFNVDPKMPSKHMGDGRLTADPEAYELPGVPWVSFFEFTTGVAFHGTYWHDNFGSRMSHGCVNMRPDEAKWLYRWSTPVAKPSDWNRMGYGTRVEVY